MVRYGKWETIRELGRGGQGVTHLARDTSVFDQEKLSRDVTDAISTLATSRPNEPVWVRQLAQSLQKLLNPLDLSYVGALKVLYEMAPSEDAQKARRRMVDEVRAFRTVAHPNLLRLLDAGIEENWYTSEYHERGALSKHPDPLRGDIVASLKAFRPLVEAVATLHGAGLVHRDIKPGNVFLASDGQLVLGDMGLVYFVDDQRTRVSETYENVGSRDWMPAWAMGMRLDQVRPSFDVFSLGKLLWSMLSGKPVLRLWYWNDPDYPEFNLEKLFPEDPNIRWANYIFEKTVVEREKDCLPSAAQLLEEVDRILAAVRRNAQVIRPDVKRLCMACGLGTYDRGPDHHNFGLQPTGSQIVSVFTCDHCGHVQLFRLPRGLQDPPPAWKKA